MKRIISLVLSVVMLMSVVFGMTFTAQAATNKTKSEAVAWAKSQVGKALDYDGSYGAQCVDFIYYYYKYLGKTPQGGNASAYISNTVPSGWSRISVSTNTALKAGDIAVYKTNITDGGTAITGSNGHVSIVASDTSGSTFTCYQQNSKNRQYVTKDSGIKKSYLKCVIRPDFKSEAYTLTVYYNANGSGINLDGNYKLVNDVIYNKSTGMVADKWEYNKTHQYGLYDYTTFGLNNPYYSFVGWGTTKTGGKVFDQKDSTVKPSDLNANVANGNCSITLYAIWKPYTLSVTFNANGGTVNSGNYSLGSDSIVRSRSTGKNVTQSWTYSDGKKLTGLYNASTFNLIKPGYVFNGWLSYDNTAIAGDMHVNENTYVGWVHDCLYFRDANSVLYANWKACTSHTYNSTLVTAPTCAKTGTRKYTCTACSYSYTESVPATGNHTYDSGKVTKQPTTTATGVKTYTCTGCGATKTETVPKLAETSTTKPAATTVKNGWQKENGKWYYYKSNAKQTGWQKVSGKWYYLNASGVMLAGWQKLSGKWYYLSASGAMVTGWHKISGKWYYFNTGGDMKTGWLKDGGSWYYLESSGAMLASTTQTINGKRYQFNSSGVCTNP
ncbi:MAG: CHAP domain-containing protein [Eubacterium sp.]|nr:CHAP domain-containing protein [Eubacterium sp.]